MITYLHLLLRCMPVGFPNLSMLCFFGGKKRESFSYTTSVKRASALFYIKTPFKNPQEEIRWLSWSLLIPDQQWPILPS